MGGSAALGWGSGAPPPADAALLPALLGGVQRLLQPGLDDRACSLVGSLILELLRHAGPQMVRWESCLLFAALADVLSHRSPSL